MNKKINDNLMVFESNPDFSDNSRGLWEYIEKNTDYETFWVIKDQKTFDLLKKHNINCGMINSDLANFMIDTAKFLITSSFEFAYQKKEKQIHVSAWHGFPLKLIGFFDSATATSNFDTFNNLKIITIQSDIITATSRLSQLTMSGLLAVDPRKVKETGFPRNDLMFCNNGKEQLKKITDIDVDNSKLILYLPTMRKGLKNEGIQFEKNIFNYPDYNPNLIDNFLEKNNAYIFTKLHFADNEYYTRENFNLPKRLIFLNTDSLNNKLLTIYHIMNAFDILITDYSSVYVDFLLLDKPIIFSCPDLSKYKQDRGFVVNDPEDLMPGAIVKKQETLIKNLNDLLRGKDNFSKIRHEKFSLFHSHKDGNSSKRLLKEMTNLLTTDIQDSSKDIGKYFLPKMSPLYQYTLNGKAEFYFDIGNGFNESSKITKFYKIDTNNSIICFELSIPKNTKNIRFDPDDIGRWILKDFLIQLDNVAASYTVIAGKEIDNKIYLTHDDPQILINLNGNNYDKIKITYNCIDLYLNSENNINEIMILEDRLENLKNNLDTINKRLDISNNIISSMENSKSWKITKPLRSISNFIKNIKVKL